MLRSTPNLAALCFLTLALSVTACAPPDEDGPPAGRPDTVPAETQTQNDQDWQPTSTVEVEITDCAGDSVSIRVSPWVANVRQGDPLTWSTSAEGADSVAIQAKDPGQWPFEWEGQRQRMARPPGEEIAAGNATRGEVGRTYRYHIVVYCGGRILDIDPDIVVRNPWGISP
jgi:hypothetical protein